MQHQRMGQAIIAGPIEDTGQLALALVIHTLAGQDGWVYKTGKQLAKLAHLSKNTGYKKLDALEKLGLIEGGMFFIHFGGLVEIFFFFY